MLEIISKILPIIILFIVGIFIRKYQYLSYEGMENIKKLVVNIALPAVLFKAFFIMKFDFKYLKLSLIIICLLIFMYILGLILVKLKVTSCGMGHFFCSGFSFGLIGIPFFTIMYGEENLALFSIIGLGHEIFIWFFYYTLVNMKLYNKNFSISYIKNFLKSPLIISIFFGLLLNIFEIYKLIDSNFFVRGFFSAFNYIGSLATPLILIIIGYSSKIKIKNLNETLRLIFSRLLCVFISAIFFKIFIINKLFEKSWLLEVSFITFIILPPVYSLTVFLGIAQDKKNEELISNATIIYTIISTFMFVVMAFYFK